MPGVGIEPTRLTTANFKSAAANQLRHPGIYFPNCEEHPKYNLKGTGETQAGLEPAHNAFAERRVDQLRHWVFLLVLKAAFSQPTAILAVSRDFVYFLAILLADVERKIEEGNS